MPTLLQFWQQQLAIHEATQAAAQGDLASAQARLAGATAQLATNQKALAKAGSDIAAARAQLAETPVPADAEPLLDLIAGLIVTQRGLQGAVLDDQDDLTAAQAAAEAAAAALARASANASAARAAIGPAEAADARRAGLRTLLAAPPISTLRTDATNLLASATVTDATSRVNTNFPTAVRTIAGKRYDTRVDRLASLRATLEQAQNALAAARVADEGLAGTAAQRRLAFERAQAALADYVATASSRLTRALAVMAMLQRIELDTTGTVPDVLTAAQKAQLAEDAAAGAAAEPTAEALDVNMQAIFAAEDALDAQILTSIAANVDGVPADPQVIAKRGAIGGAKTTFETALAAFAAANKDDLDRWHAAIPDTAWRVLVEYQEGLDALNALSATDPAALATAMDTAESDYAAALTAAALSRRRADAIGDAIAGRQDLLDAARAAVAARLPSATRGDSY